MGTRGQIALQGSAGGRLTSFIVLLACLMPGGNPSYAQGADASCAPAMARLVSIQGSVDLQRAGVRDWMRITRLDTSVCPGDRLRTAPLSRAALFLQPETLVRVDQNTTITLSQTTDEVLVEFLQLDVAPASIDEQSCGVGYFITRFPKKFRISTPHVNAAVEGTEFQVAMRCRSSEVTVLEGKVRTHTVGTGEDRVLTDGQQLITDPSTPAVFNTLITPADAVQWVLYYPPLSDAKAEGEIPAAAQCRGLPAPSNQVCFTQRGEALLRLGRSDEALRDVDEALALNSANGDANALRAIIHIARNDKAAALRSATAATNSSPNSYRAWLALSYAQQASFELEQALASARKAQALEPNNSLVNARVAELLLSLGHTGEAEAAARAAVASNPAESSAHTTLGFVHLAQFNTRLARTDFEAGIDRDSFNPLPRLGLGLALIRDGKLQQGREQLEIAVALDPGNSLVRSYVGKAYYEENTPERDQLAGVQLDAAKELDPNDPTPWFYGAILKYSQTRPAEALQDLHKAAELNDDRAVYRSRLLLDQDAAAQNASQAVIYNELGFHQLGLIEAAQSLAIDPASGAAHRFLADTYATLPRHDIARASELLQSQLRQPLGAPPLQAQLANDVQFRSAFFGPATVGLNEFNPLFISNGFDLQLFGLAGEQDTHADQVIVSGLQGPVSFSLSQYAADTDGFRPNNDDRQRQYDGFVQWQLGAGTSAQLEVTHAERDTGDLQSSFDSTFFLDNLRTEEETDTQRFGMRQVVDSRSDILLSVIRQDRQGSLSIDDPGFPQSLLSDQDSWKAEVQYLASTAGLDVILGATYFEAESRDEFVTPLFTEVTQSTPSHVNAYGYVLFPASAGYPHVQLGVSYDDLRSEEIGNQEELNPKLGLTWKVADAVTLRAAAFRVLKRRINSDQGLEPTQLAGINQFYDDPNGTVSEGGGLAADFALRADVQAGLQFTRRNLDAPFDLAGEVFFQQRTEKAASGYLYWLPTSRFSVSIEPRYQEFDGGTLFDTMDLTEVPLSVRYFSPSGLWMGVSVTGVKQSGEFDTPAGVVAGSDDFVLLDAIVAYRLPRRMGTISLQGNNLLDEQFQFQEIDQTVLPRYVPERQVLLRFSLSF